MGPGGVGSTILVEREAIATGPEIPMAPAVGPPKGAPRRGAEVPMFRTAIGLGAGKLFQDHSAPVLSARNPRKRPETVKYATWETKEAAITDDVSESVYIIISGVLA